MATETIIDVVMPQMGVSVSEGTVTKWLKQEGEAIAADEALLALCAALLACETCAPSCTALAEDCTVLTTTIDVSEPLPGLDTSGVAYSDYSPAPNFDGSLIAFVSTRDDPQGEIYLMNSDGSNIQ